MREVTLTPIEKVNVMLDVSEKLQNKIEHLHVEVEECDTEAVRRATEEVRSQLLVAMQFAKEIYDATF